MQENQLYSKPLPPNKWISKIYPKTDWFWYYMNYDWIEIKLWEWWWTINWGDIEWDINNQVDLIDLINNITNNIDWWASASVYLIPEVADWWWA